MTDTPADATSPQAIAARSDARLAKRIAYLENELKGKIAIIQTLSDELAAERRKALGASAVLQTALAERDAAQAAASFHEANAAQVASALSEQGQRRFGHIASALQKRATA
jgi:hypothetical protein